MDIAGVVLGVLGVVLLLHQTVLPLVHKRAALWYGRQALATTVALIAAVATQWWPAGLLLIPAVAIAVAWGPWVAWGAPASSVTSAAKRSASMVRARFEPADARPGQALVGGAATVRVRRLAPGVTVITLTGERTPKVKLWRNLFRKQILNQSFLLS